MSDHVRFAVAYARHRGLPATVAAVADLVQFLLDRIAEDEAAARAALGRRWKTSDDEFLDIEDAEHDHTGIVYSSSGGGVVNWQTAEHIARWDPARVLAECQTKRRIIEEHPLTIHTDKAAGVSFVLNAHICPGVSSPCMTLRLLTFPYAHHPDYREEWRP